MTDTKTSDETLVTSLDGTERTHVIQKVSGTWTDKAVLLSNLGTLGSAIAKIAKTLRRAVNAYRPEPSAIQRALAYTQFEAARKTNTDGSLTVWEPDGSGFYGAAWTRDQAMSMEYFLEYFTAAEISAVATYWLSKSNTTTGEVPDHIAHDGTVSMAPAPTGRGSRAPTDGNYFLLQMFWLHYVMTGSPSLYVTNKVALKQLLEFAALYNGSTGCARVDDTSPYVGFGFFDMAIITGDVLFTSILAVRGFQMAAEMEYFSGDGAEATRLLARSVDVKNGISSTLLHRRAGTGAELGSGYSAREFTYGYLATTKGANQIDLWSTAYLVWCDILSDTDAKAAANYLYYATTSSSDNFFRGGLRNVDKTTDYTANTQVYQSTFVAKTYGTYQNGGYWPTPMPWLLYAIAMIEPVKARQMYLAMHSYSLEQGTASLGEWWNASGTFGATKYLTSVAALLAMAMPDGPVLIEDEWGGVIRTVTNETINIVLVAAFPGILLNTKTKSASGTATATFKINGTSVGGSANSVSSTQDSRDHVSLCTFAVGDTISMTVSANSACVDLYFVLTYLRAA